MGMSLVDARMHTINTCMGPITPEESINDESSPPLPKPKLHKFHMHHFPNFVKIYPLKYLQ